MKIKFLVGLEVVALVVMTSFTAFAQNEENKALIEVVNDPIPAQAVQSSSKANQTATQTQVAPVVVAPVSQPMFVQQPQIVQQQPNIYIQKQAATVVEDSPLTESAADKLRKQRVEMEQQTESKIVEKLEEARMKAEQERAKKLLTGLEDKKEEQKEEAKVEAVVVPVVAPVVVAPQAIQVVEPTFVEVKPEPALEVKTELAKLDEETKKDRMYISVGPEFISYDANNVDTGVGGGVSIGKIFDERYMVEGNFVFARADVEEDPTAFTPWGAYPTIIKMDQYGFGGTFKYRILKSRFSPYVGGSLAYVHRNYDAKQTPGCYSYYGNSCDLEASSWAIDMGALVGADISLSENLSIGSEFKYMFNVAYDTSTNGAYEQSKLLYPSIYSNPIEELGYYSLSLSLKYSF